MIVSWSDAAGIHREYLNDHDLLSESSISTEQSAKNKLELYFEEHDKHSNCHPKEWNYSYSKCLIKSFHQDIVNIFDMVCSTSREEKIKSLQKDLQNNWYDYTPKFLEYLLQRNKQRQFGILEHMFKVSKYWFTLPLSNLMQGNCGTTTSMTEKSHKENITIIKQDNPYDTNSSTVSLSNDVFRATTRLTSGW